MSTPSAAHSDDVLTMSIVLFHSPLEPLRALLDSLIASLAAADISSVQCVLVDHSLTQSYTERCQALLAEYQACQWIQLRLLVPLINRGYGGGHNLAMENLRGQFHLILNPDVALSRQAVSLALETMVCREDLALLAPVGSSPDGATLHLAKAFPSVWALALRAFAPAWLRRRCSGVLARYELRDQSSKTLRPVPLVSGCCMWVRRAIYDKVGGFDDRYFLYFEDFDLSLRMAQHGAVMEHRELTIIHHGGNTSQKGWRHLGWFFKSAVRFFNRWGWKWLG